MKHLFLNSMMAGILAILATGLNGATLDPGDSIMMPGATGVTAPQTTGTILQDDILSTNFVSIPPSFPLLGASFDVQNRVIESGVDGTMVFMPRLFFGVNTTSGNLLVYRVEMYGFGDFGIDAFFRTDLPGDRGPTSGSRSADGDMLEFSFGFPLVISNLIQGPHEESYFFALKTDARRFENTGRLSIFARAQGNDYNTYRFDVGGLAVPVLAPVPLPASGLLLFGILAGIFGLRHLGKP